MIELDAAVPDLEGRRVRVKVEPLDEGASPEDLASAWTAWIAVGRDEPTGDDGDPELP